MDTHFLSDNRHLETAERYDTLDPHLNQLKTLPYIKTFAILDKFPVESGIYTICGAHQTGKTTLLKRWIERLLAATVQPERIAFFAAELAHDYHGLYRLLKNQIKIMPLETTRYLIVDEVTAVRDWIKAINLLINEGLLERVVLMLSGSYRSLPDTVKDHFPARPQNSPLFDFYLSPLSFRETVLLKQGSTPSTDTLYKEFQQYLRHGGFLSAINETAIHGHILDKTFTNYSDWIQKEFIRHGKQERFLHEILNAILGNYNHQITWNALAKQLTIDHPKTIGDYFATLEDMDVLFVQHALIEETLTPAPKKARKLMFLDPFLFHAIRAAFSSLKNNFYLSIQETLDDPAQCAKLVETCVITQFQRVFPTYYIKSEGAVDLAYVHDARFWPIETTWAGRVRSKDLKQILKYNNGRILTKTERSGIIEHIKTEPLPVALWQLGSVNDD